jgi:hypothetical protein
VWTRRAAGHRVPAGLTRIPGPGGGHGLRPGLPLGAGIGDRLLCAGVHGSDRGPGGRHLATGIRLDRRVLGAAVAPRLEFLWPSGHPC